MAHVQSSAEEITQLLNDGDFNEAEKILWSCSIELETLTSMIKQASA
jgi:hypothetical protein